MAGTGMAIPSENRAASISPPSFQAYRKMDNVFHLPGMKGADKRGFNRGHPGDRRSRKGRGR